MGVANHLLTEMILQEPPHQVVVVKHIFFVRQKFLPEDLGENELILTHFLLRIKTDVSSDQNLGYLLHIYIYIYIYMLPSSVGITRITIAAMKQESLCRNQDFMEFNGPMDHRENAGTQ